MNEHISKYPDTFYRISLKAVIRNQDGHVLVNREHDSKTWSLPGGGYEHGETTEECLKRELREEVGYEGAFIYTIKDTARFWIESRHAWLFWVVYDVQPQNLDFSVGSDSSEITFINPADFDATSLQEKWIARNL